MTPTPPNTYSWTQSSALMPNTLYYWTIVSKDNATPINPNMIGTSQTFSFTTSGGSGGPLPSPWVRLTTL